MNSSIHPTTVVNSLQPQRSKPPESALGALKVRSMHARGVGVDTGYFLIDIAQRRISLKKSKVTTSD